jgi:hypothetical protein
MRELKVGELVLAAVGNAHDVIQMKRIRFNSTKHPTAADGTTMILPDQ